MYFKNFFRLSLLSIFIYSEIADANTIFHFMNGKHDQQNVIEKIVKENFSIDEYEQIKVQSLYNPKTQSNDFILYLLPKNNHNLITAKINMDHSQLISIEKNFTPTLQPQETKCPDPTIEFIAFAPNDNDLEQKITMNVAKTAERQGLKTIQLLRENATRENYLNYLVCPQLKGNFYDGNANPYMILTYDGFIHVDEIQTILTNQFHYKVTHIWVAGEAFENPMESAMIDVAKAQKFIAGESSLTIGLSDLTGWCTMKKAIHHESIAESFASCYAKYGIRVDRWGLGGYGSDYFGK